MLGPVQGLGYACPVKTSLILCVNKPSHGNTVWNGLKCLLSRKVNIEALTQRPVICTSCKWYASTQPHLLPQNTYFIDFQTEVVKRLRLPICQWPNRCCCFLQTSLVFFVVLSMKTIPLWLHNTFLGCWQQPSYHLIGCAVLRIKKIENIKIQY